MLTGPNTSGRCHAGFPSHRAAASETWGSLSGESDPAKSTCPAMNCSRPAPEPVGLYDRFLPGHCLPHSWLNTAIAFCWAVDPSAVSEFFPAQSADFDPGAPAPAAPSVLLSLPQPLNPRPRVAANNAIPAVLGFIASRFLTRRSDPPGTYVALMDGNRMAGERVVNRSIAGQPRSTAA